MIYMSDIRNRITNLNESATNNLNVSVDTIHRNLLKTNPINLEMAKICISNYPSMNSATAISDILEMFDLVCERNSASDIRAIGNAITETIIPKVRDGVQTNALVKHRISRFKTKLSTKINNNIANTSDAVKDSVANAKKNLGDNVNKAISNAQNGLPHKKEEQANAANECYEKMLEKSNMVNQCDRVLVNYEKLSKRFNIDKIVRESAFYDLRRAISEVCTLIDTYTVPYKAKYNIALESSMYAFERNGIPYTRSAVLEYTTDYFLSKEDAKVSDINDIVKTNPFFSDEDKTGLEYITELDPEPTTDDEIPNSYNIIMNIDSLAEASTEETVKDLINKFKLIPNKTAEGLKALVRKIYTKTPDQICSETPNFLSWIRVALLDGGAFAIHPIVGVVVLIADQAIAMSFKRDETKKMLDGFKSEKTKAEKKLASVKTDESKKKYEEYIKSLDKSINKITNYYEGLHTSEENSDRYDKEHEDDDNDSDDFDFDVNFESSILNVIGDACRITEACEELAKIDTKEMLSDIDANISKMSLNDIDTITSVFTMTGDKSTVNELSNIFSDHKKDIYNNRHNVSESSQCAKYMEIDCLNYNMARLESANASSDVLNIDNFRPEQAYNVLVKLEAKIDTYKCLNEMLSIYSNGSSILEASFTNSLKMAGEKLKKSAVKLSDTDKTVSRNIDMTMNNFTKAAERAVTNDNREAIIKGSLLPSASKMLKMALGAGATAALINPVVAVIGVLGYLGASSKMKAKERQAIIDEIEIELKMVERYMKIAEDNNDLKAQRQLLTTQRTLERQLQRIKYKMKVDFKQDIPTPNASSDDD